MQIDSSGDQMREAFVTTKSKDNNIENNQQEQIEATKSISSFGKILETPGSDAYCELLTATFNEDFKHSIHRIS